MGLIKHDRQLAVTRSVLTGLRRSLATLKVKYGRGTKWRLVSAGPLDMIHKLEQEVREYLWLKKATPAQVMRRYRLVRMSEIGPFLARLRIASGMTQAELARRVGCHQPDIARIEDADYQAHSTTTLKAIADALEIELVLGARRAPRARRVG
jgi:DNA-binding XRE family transcriptional regulator